MYVSSLGGIGSVGFLVGVRDASLSVESGIVARIGGSAPALGEVAGCSSRDGGAVESCRQRLGNEL